MEKVFPLSLGFYTACMETEHVESWCVIRAKNMNDTLMGTYGQFNSPSPVH